MAVAVLESINLEDAGPKQPPPAPPPPPLLGPSSEVEAGTSQASLRPEVGVLAAQRRRGGCRDMGGLAGADGALNGS